MCPMKTFAFPSFLLLTLFAASYGQDIRSGRWLNGKAWGIMDLNQRAAYVSGLEEGSNITIMTWNATSSPKPPIKDVRHLEDNFVADGAFTIEDKMTQIDIFYRDEKNTPVPIAFAYLYTIKKFRGASEEELKVFESRIREDAGKW